MTTSKDQLSGWTEQKCQNTSQSQTYTRKGSWLLFGGLLLVGPTTAFRIPAKSLYLRSMLSKLMKCNENFNTCSWHWSIDWTQFSNNAQPHSTQSTLQKLNELSHKVLPYLTSHQPTTTSSSTSATFLHRKCFPNHQDTKIAFQAFVES